MIEEGCDRWEECGMANKDLEIGLFSFLILLSIS